MVPLNTATLTKFSKVPAKGDPIGLTTLLRLQPNGDRGLVFGRSFNRGISLGKIPGYWTCPYDGLITGVILNTNLGGYTINIWKNSNGYIPTAADSICVLGFSIQPPDTHVEILDLRNLIELDVDTGDTFAVEVTAVTDPPPTDIGGNVVILADT